MSNILTILHVSYSKLSLLCILLVDLQTTAIYTVINQKTKCKRIKFLKCHKTHYILLWAVLFSNCSPSVFSFIPTFPALQEVSWERGWKTIARQRQWHKENWHFEQCWQGDFFSTDVNAKAVCLICKKSVAVLKEYNSHWHFDTAVQITYTLFF